MVTELAAGFLGGLIGYAIGTDGKVHPVSQEQMNRLLRDTKPEFLKKVDIDTSIARDGEEGSGEYPVAGSFIIVLNPTTPTLPVYIKLNEPGWPKLPLTDLRRVTGPFYRFFIENAAGEGTLSLIVAKGYQFQFTEAGMYSLPSSPRGPTYAMADLGELAARLGSIVTFDRRGNVIWTDDFQSGVNKWWLEGASTSTFTWSSRTSNGNGFCGELATNANLYGDADIYVSRPFPVLSKMGFEFSFCLDQYLLELYLDVTLYDGTNYYNGVVKWINASDKCQCGGNDLSPTIDLMESSSSLHDFYWNTIKLVIDFTTKKYVRLIVNDVTYDLTSYSLTSSSSSYRMVNVHISIMNNSTNITILYLGNMIITQNEP